MGAAASCVETDPADSFGRKTPTTRQEEASQSSESKIRRFSDGLIRTLEAFPELPPPSLKVSASQACGLN